MLTACIPARYVIALFLFLTITLLFVQRTAVDVAIISMVNHTAISDSEDVPESKACLEITPENDTISSNKEGPYVWSQSKQGIILGSYFYGNVFAQMTSGAIIFLIGPKNLLIICCIISSAFLLLTPYSANFHLAIIAVIQIIIGLAQGTALTTTFTLLARWTAESENSTLPAIVHTGVVVGLIIGMVATGYLCESTFLGGWPSAFYVFGTSGLIFSILLLFMIYDKPQNHPRISEKELLFLSENIPNIDSHENKNVPWRAILTSKEVLVVFFAKFCWGCSYYTLVTKAPSFLKIILHFPIDQNGLMNALFFMGYAITSFMSGFIADWIIKRRYLSTTATRKLSESIALFGPGLCMIAVPLLRCDSTKIIVILFVSMIFFGFTSSGDTAIVFDLAPDFAGVLFGLTNGSSSIGGFLSPYIAGLILDKDQGSMALWSYVFYFTAFFYILGGLTFLIGANAKLQSWGISKPSEVTKEETKF